MGPLLCEASFAEGRVAGSGVLRIALVPIVGIRLNSLRSTLKIFRNRLCRFPEIYRGKPFQPGGKAPQGTQSTVSKYFLLRFTSYYFIFDLRPNYLIYFLLRTTFPNWRKTPFGLPGKSWNRGQFLWSPPNSAHCSRCKAANPFGLLPFFNIPPSHPTVRKNIPSEKNMTA